MVRSSILGLPEKTRSRLEELWQGGHTSLDELTALAGGASRAAIYRWLAHHASDAAYVRRVRSALLRVIADKTSTEHSADLTTADIVRLSEALGILNSILDKPSHPPRRPAKQERRSEQRASEQPEQPAA
jgi:hypothetical protein